MVREARVQRGGPRWTGERATAFSLGSAHPDEVGSGEEKTTAMNDDMRIHSRLFVGGTWAQPKSTTSIDVVEAHSEQVIGRVPDANAADVDAAVTAARMAFDHSDWPRLAVEERAAALQRLIDGFGGRSEEMAHTISSENGAPIKFSRLGQVGAPMDIMASMIDVASQMPVEARRHGRYMDYLVRREPMGVVGAIVAWNVPQVLIAVKLAPALLAGCTVIVKAAPEASLDAMILAEIIDAAGFPPGTISVLTGGVEAGQSLVRHSGVDKISFTGSTAAGRLIGERCGRDLRRCSLELGGKSAAIMLDDVDLHSAVNGLRFTSFINNGQACAAQTRILAPRRRYAEAVEAIAALADTLSVGDPHNPDTKIGPLVSRIQRDRVRRYIETGRREGARLVVGGSEPPVGLPQGWFVQPTIFADVDNRMRIAQEEIFGPVLSVIPYDDDAEAIRLANDSAYGLAGSVWTSDAERGLQIARGVRTGTFGINGYAPDPLAPFGGFKASGLGREWGEYGLDEFVEIKAVNGLPT
jgi:aldehyde dehydrogenase (NAD+)